ncbi:RNA methyltransferase [Arenibacter sp. GZD96]|uniref:TrmH family RNA methyltransferase n=1 Tax=Aurantibrevibacter litoralis TaxID=3106030 RepID=UPI002AFFBF95|nr:RNA methyltransferase [Arenibacter sp. GZD-96]MEA1786958.1 RNA methyltransferase [Arenibacter sp. GZD-96]
MVVKSQIKFIKNLQQKKYRNQNGLFVVEGVKTIQTLLDAGFSVQKIYVTQTDIIDAPSTKPVLITDASLKKMSSLVTPNKALGVFYIPKMERIEFSDWVVALDDVRDPGNLGTIIRLCDWFGIRHLVCSLHTVDCYNPKVLQATMGSISRVNVVYTDLYSFLKEVKTPVFGTFMQGASVYQVSLPPSGVLVLGNEAKGISDGLQALISEKISIPQFGEKTAESLNVATATAIFLGEIRRGYSETIIQK